MRVPLGHERLLLLWTVEVVAEIGHALRPVQRAGVVTASGQVEDESAVVPIDQVAQCAQRVRDGVLAMQLLSAGIGRHFLAIAGDVCSFCPAFVDT